MTSGGGGAVTREREATRSELRRLEFLHCAPGAQENQSPPSPARRPPPSPRRETEAGTVTEDGLHPDCRSASQAQEHRSGRRIAPQPLLWKKSGPEQGECPVMNPLLHELLNRHVTDLNVSLYI